MQKLQKYIDGQAVRSLVTHAYLSASNKSAIIKSLLLFKVQGPMAYINAGTACELHLPKAESMGQGLAAFLDEMCWHWYLWA